MINIERKDSRFHHHHHVDGISEKEKERERKAALFQRLFADLSLMRIELVAKKKKSLSILLYNFVHRELGGGQEWSKQLVHFSERISNPWGLLCFTLQFIYQTPMMMMMMMVSAIIILTMASIYTYNSPNKLIGNHAALWLSAVG